MRRRQVPRTISKRLSRKLRRARWPFLLWLRCRKPAVYARLARFQWYRWLQAVTDISPVDTPLITMARRTTADSIISEWVIDDLVRQ